MSKFQNNVLSANQNTEQNLSRQGNDAHSESGKEEEEEGKKENSVIHVTIKKRHVFNYSPPIVNNY
jgi:hypothetical protein